MPSNLYTNIQEINSVKQNIYNSMAAVNYPITNITSLANYSQLINNYTRNNDGYIISYNSNITNNLINSGKLFNSDTIVTFDNTEIWCTDDYVVSGRKYYNLQVVNNVTLPRAITGEIKDTSTIYKRSLCKYFNSTYARFNFIVSGSIMSYKWVNFIWDSNDGIHYTLNTSKSTSNIFNVNSQNCLNSNYIYLNGTYDWPLQYFLFDGYMQALTSITRMNDNVPEIYNFGLTAENVIGSTKYIGKNGIMMSSIERDLITDKNALLNRVNLYQNVPNFDTSNITNTANMFRNYQNLPSVPNFNTSNVTNMANMFASCFNLTTVPNFDTRNVTSMYAMFGSCYNLTTVPNFNTSNVISMSSMFAGCNNLTSVPNFDTRNVNRMSAMFSSCHNLTSVPNFDTSEVYTMSEMFRWCNKLTTVPNFNTSNVSTMNHMFQGCQNLAIVSNYNTSKVNNIAYMFSGCYNLTSASNFDTNNVINMYAMFGSCHNLVNVPQFNAINVIDMGQAFQNCNNLSDASVQNIINMCLNSNITNTTIKNLNIGNTYSPFYNTNITSTRYSNRLSELTAAGWTY